MKRFPGQEFEVVWLPFQLDANASKAGVNKVEMYMRKFNMTKERCMEMSRGMGERFAECGLQYKFTDQSRTGNTFNSHRLINLAGSMGAATQDVVVEELFKNYFAEEKFLNDPEVLIAAAIKGGIAEDEAKKFIADESMGKTETDKEMQYGRSLGVSGVPHFVVSANGKKFQLSGAQPAAAFVEIFEELA